MIFSREQFYLDLIFSEDFGRPNTYNILKKAGSSLGFKHTEESLAKMIEAMTDEKKAKLRKINKRENNPRYGISPSAETLIKMRNSQIGNKNLPPFGADSCGIRVKKYLFICLTLRQKRRYYTKLLILVLKQQNTLIVLIIQYLEI